MSEAFALVADGVFDGDVMHAHAAVIIEDQHIVAIKRRAELGPGLRQQAMPQGAWLAPGFIDVQVNGGGDVLFNDQPTAAGIARVVAAHRRFGTTSLLPTLISDTTEKMRHAIVAVQRAMEIEPAVLGVHFEGPFLSPEKPGVHDPAMLRMPGSGDFELLTGLKDAVTLVTLAPERVPTGFIASLTRAEIRVCLGHSMATYAETKRAMAEGLTGFTHLFNAMRPIEAREPGPIAAALESGNAWFGLIVDGHHVAPPLLRLAANSAGRPMLVTDAMPPVGGTQSGFKLYGQEITARDGRCMRADGRLAGSMLDMASAVRNCVQMLGMDLLRALRLASAEPAAFLGVGDRLGAVAPGYRADLVVLDPHEIRVLGVWQAGKAIVGTV